jgi:hypothetical protein
MASRIDRRLILAGGAALALAAGLVAAVVLGGRGANPTQAPPASQAGLMVQTGRDDDVKLDPKRPLRCFVGGKLVGELPLSDCARRNGVATGALDVGVDPSGALAAANGVTAQITPLAPETPSATAPEPAREVAEGPVAEETPLGAGGEPQNCWRYAGATWNELARPMGLAACVQTLYDGECEPPGLPAYGRWGDRTLRLLSGQVAVSRDNRTFRPLVEQGPGCTVPQGQ